MGLISWIKDKAFIELERKVVLLGAFCEKLEDQVASLRARINNAGRSRGYASSPRDSVSENTSGEEDLPSLSDLPAEYLQSLPPEELATLKKALNHE